MGVPTFFRWVSEKYPKITQKCVEEEPSVYSDGTELPVDATQPNPNGMEFDNLYLDMNGIIHPCTHPEDGKEPPTMELMFVAIGKHIDRLFRLVRPRKLLYMAIDGIAPRAKMNQQRSRRFRSALEADEAREDKEKVLRSMRSRGLRVPDDSAGGKFDSNVITPGTDFMDKLAEYLRFFILDKQTNDPSWATCKVILSDAQSPGEGEHKIMQFVRRQRAEVGHDPNTHHVMYGLDADLIMLGLASHEVRFTVLRDQVFFGKQNRKAGVKVDSVLGPSAGDTGDGDVPVQATGALSVAKLKPIEMLHVWILREYLQHEFRAESFAAPLPFPYDFERCIDDFVFLCFFVGNDFLPHLPSLSIREGGLELLINLYRKVLPTLDGFLTEDGDLHLGRVDALMKVLGTVEDRIFQMRKAQEDREKNRKKMVKNAQANNGRGAGDNNADAETEGRSNNKRRRVDITALPPTHVDEKDLTPLGPSSKLPLRNSEEPTKQPVAAPTASQNKSAAAALRAQLNGGAKEAEPKESEGKKEAGVEEAKEEEEEELADELEEELMDESLTYEERIKLLQDKRNIPVEEVKDDIRLGEAGWKERYYESKFGKEAGSDAQLRRRVVESYVRGLCWVLQYYYKGCQSWKWYFEFHYAPFASDLTDLASIDTEWAPSRPFKPFEQLMAVLPPQSAPALPEPCRRYMTDEDSEIADFYPRTIQFDPNGKPVRWLWVALLPFIDENRLLEVTKRIESKLNKDERRRNAMMPDLLFVPKNAPGSGEIRRVLTASPPNLLPNWESDQIAILKDSQSKLFGSALHLPAPTTAGDVRGGGRDEIFLAAPQAGGISGFFLPAAPEFKVEVGDKVASPNPRVMDSLPVCEAFVCEFRLAPMLPHLSRLCEGVQIPARVLTEQDLQIRRPRLSGMDVSSLLGGDGRHSASGLERSWGSAEPERKQYNNHHHYQQQQQMANPFLHPPPPLIPGLQQQHQYPQAYGRGYEQPQGYYPPQSYQAQQQYGTYDQRPVQQPPRYAQGGRDGYGNDYRDSATGYPQQQQHVSYAQYQQAYVSPPPPGAYPQDYQQYLQQQQQHYAAQSSASMLQQLQQTLHQHQQQGQQQQQGWAPRGDNGYGAHGYPSQQGGGRGYSNRSGSDRR